jgi:hypothetical protein
MAGEDEDDGGHGEGTGPNDKCLYRQFAFRVRSLL